MSKIEYKLIKTYPGSPSLNTIHWYDGIDVLHLRSHPDWMGTNFYNSYPEYWELVKPRPLFTTEDGVDIYKNNHPDIFYVNLKSFSMGIDYSNTLCNPDLMNYKYFSTKEKAEEYIKYNKPMYSINDIKNSCKQVGIPVISSVYLCTDLIDSKK